MLGAVLFAFDHLRAGRAEDPRRIVLSREVDQEARRLFASSRGREPGAEELQALRRVWLDNEVLYREGLAPVEASIALSIMLVVGEALRERRTLARRWSALVAFLFGLVHGLGFAGALKDIGLPDQHLWVAIATFNGGGEIGQLLTVGAAWLAYRALRASALAPRLRRALLYAIGSLAAWWSLARIVTVLG